MNNKFIKFQCALLSLFSVITLSVFGVSVANAYSVAFSYDGYQIRDWPSVGQTYVSRGSTVQIVHSQKPDYSTNNTPMMVIIQRRNWIGEWDNIESNSYSGEQHNAAFYRTMPSDGVYRLRFISWDKAYTFHVWGTFNK